VAAQPPDGQISLSAPNAELTGDRAPLEADELTDEQLEPVVGGLTWEAVSARLTADGFLPA
jgi:hypothetical protein